MTFGTPADLDQVEADAFAAARYTPPAGGGAAVTLRVLQVADEAADTLAGVSIVQRKDAFLIPARKATPARDGVIALLAADGVTVLASYTISAAPTWSDAGRDYWHCTVNGA